MPGAVGRQEDGETALEGGGGVGQLAHLPLDDAQRTEGVGELGGGAVGGFLDGQGARLSRARVRMGPLAQ